jgi:hypothetical protein
MSAWLVRPSVRSTPITRSRFRSRNHPSVPSLLRTLGVPSTLEGNHGDIHSFVKSSDIVWVNHIDLLTNTPA